MNKTRFNKEEISILIKSLKHKLNYLHQQITNQLILIQIASTDGMIFFNRIFSQIAQNSLGLGAVVGLEVDTNRFF